MALWLQHPLVLFLIAGLPLWDWYEIPRLKASTDPQKKITYYGKTVAALWICALLAVSTIGLPRAFYSGASPAEAKWLDHTSLDPKFVMGLLIGGLIAIFMPALLSLRDERLRAKFAKAAHKISFLLPSTPEERRWWWVVCFTAGICEELIYRGFLLLYLHISPWHLTLTSALVISSLIFGIAHLYQGVAGALSTCVLGFLLACLFLFTGSLLAPMVIHTIIDLRVLLLFPAGFASRA